MKIGHNRHFILGRLRHLAVHYQEQERWKESEGIAIEVIWLDERCGEDSQFLVMDLRRLASIYRCQNRWEDAEIVILERMKLQDRRRGADHPLTGASAMDLVQTYMQQGRWQEAESHIVPVVAKLKRLKGENDTYTK